MGQTYVDELEALWPNSDSSRHRVPRVVRFVDEYRDPAAARSLVAHIAELAGPRSFKFMEVCGGHTHTIFRYGSGSLRRSVELVHGPGCPVCVLPMGRVDKAIALAESRG